MKKSKFTEEQRVRILMGVEAGARIAEIFNVNDEFNRESMKIEIDGSLPSARVIRVLGGLVDCVALQTTVPGRWARVHLRAALRQWTQRHALSLAICSLASRPNTGISNASIEPSVPRPWIGSCPRRCTKPAVATGTGVTATTANGHIGHRAAGNIVARKLTRSALSTLPTACS